VTLTFAQAQAILRATGATEFTASAVPSRYICGDRAAGAACAGAVAARGPAGLAVVCGAGHVGVRFHGLFVYLTPPKTN